MTQEPLEPGGRDHVAASGAPASSGSGAERAERDEQQGAPPDHELVAASGAPASSGSGAELAERDEQQGAERAERDEQQGFPVVLLLAGRRCLVVGGGRVALQKAWGLVAAGAAVTVVAPQVDDGFVEMAVTIERRPYARGEVAGYRYVVAATDVPAVNRTVFEDGEAAGVWVNAADDPANCSVTLPAVARQGPITVAVSTGGASPALAGWLRDRVAAGLGPEHETLARMLATERQALRSQGTPTEGLPWRRALELGLLDLVRSGRVDEASALLRDALGQSEEVG